MVWETIIFYMIWLSFIRQREAIYIGRQMKIRQTEFYTWLYDVQLKVLILTFKRKLHVANGLKNNWGL